MTNITIGTFGIPDANVVGSTAVLRIYASENWVDSLGVPRVGGDIGAAPNGFFKEVACTISGQVITIPQFTSPSTLDSIDKPNVRLTGIIFYGVGNKKQGPQIFTDWMIPYSPTTTTWAALTIFNLAHYWKIPSNLYLNAEQVAALLDQHIMAATQGVYEEVPAGLVNDVNVTFTLSHVPLAGTLQLFQNKQLQQEGVDYTLSGAVITFIVPPSTLDWIFAVYRTASGLVAGAIIPTQVQESGGPTVLSVGAIPDLHLFKRSGSTVIGVPDTLPPADVAFYATAGDGSTGNPWTGWESEIDTANRTYLFREGYFSYSTPLALGAFANIRLIGQGSQSTTIRFTGTGIAVSSVGVPGIRGFAVEGIHFVGNANATKGILLEKSHNSKLLDLTFDGFSSRFIDVASCVLCTIDHPKMSRQVSGVPAWSPIPTIGIETRSVSGGTGDASTQIVIDLPLIEFISGGIGVKMTNTWNSKIKFGTCEGIVADPQNADYGISIGTGCDSILIEGIDLEGNDVNDLIIDGNATRTTITNILSTGSIAVSGTGYHRIIQSLINDLAVTSPAQVRLPGTIISGTYTDTNLAPLTDLEGAATFFARSPGSTAREAAFRVYNRNGGNQWQMRQTAASDLLRFSSLDLNNANPMDYITIDLTTGVSIGNLHLITKLSQAEGAALSVSSNTIVPTHNVHQVGAGLIKNITVPSGFVGGTIALVPTAAFTYDATGNILGTGTAVVGRTMFATYSASTSKWSMSY